MSANIFNGGITGGDPLNLSGVWGVGESGMSYATFAPAAIEYVVVAGGGGGARNISGGGGGGAGGYRSSVVGEPSGGGFPQELVFAFDLGSTYAVTVGAGGAIATGAFANESGFRGSDSVFATFTATGGGGGRGSNTTGQQSGGSGGGGSNTSNERPGGVATVAQGFNGGVGHFSGSLVGKAAGGGGGASAAGVNATSTSAGDGGDGVSSSITGSATTRAGGGGGSVHTLATGPLGAGGAGGGAAGSFSVNAPAGTINTGGGGGGQGGLSAPLGGLGGSGVVILRYPSVFKDMTVGVGLAIDDGSGGNISGTGAPLSPSFTPAGFKVYMFKSGTGTVSI